MDHLYSSWRKPYFARDKNDQTCAFCQALSMPDGPSNLIVHRGKHCFVILNLYPYTSGHVMVVPDQHTNQLEELEEEVLTEMMLLAQKVVSVITRLYQPQGFNVGINLGTAGGAGIADHLHLHVVPRWVGDANFISVIGQTRVLPETLPETYQRIKEAW